MKRYIVLLTVVGIAVYFFVVREYMAYRQVVTERNHIAWDAYYSDFPHGWHMEEVRYIDVDVSHNINSVRSFLNSFPDSELAGRVKTIRDSLWDEEILLYKSRAQYYGIDTGGVTFLNKVLQYMKAHDNKEIYIQMNGTLKLKDYQQYSAEARAICENELYTDYPFANNMASLTSSFQTGDIEYLEKIVSDGVSKSFNRVFNPDFVSVVAYHRTDNYADSNDLFIKVNYTIQNLEFKTKQGVVTPDLWICTQDSAFLCYEPGIEVNFDCSMSLPGTSISYKFNNVSSSSDAILDAGSTEEFYRRLTSNTFAVFANNVSESFGIEGSYGANNH